MVKWWNQVNPMGHKEGNGWVQAPTNTFESPAFNLVTVKKVELLSLA